MSEISCFSLDKILIVCYLLIQIVNDSILTTKYLINISTLFFCIWSLFQNPTKSINTGYQSITAIGYRGRYKGRYPN